MVTSRGLYLGFLALLGLERLVELLLSLHNARQARAAGAIEAGRGHYPVMVAFHSAFLVACALEVVLVPRSFPGALGWTALGVAVAAQGLRYWAVASLGVRWNTRVLVWPGLPPVTSGPYRFLRHPNYLAVVLEMLAVPLVYGAWVTAVVFSLGNLLLLRVRIRSEEAALGPSWAEAFGSRPRLIPELHRGE
jgi:methyltransferase